MKWLLALFAAAYICLLLWRVNDLNTELASEKAAHKTTKIERDDWKTQAEAAKTSAEALAENARACLAREAQALANAAERATIMAKVKPRPRTMAEQTKVVDDETRSRVVERLNRAL